MSKKSKREKKRAFYKRKTFWGGLGLLFLVVLGVGAHQGYKFLLPFYEQAQNYDMERIYKVKDPSLILDRTGQEYARMFVENRDQIPVTEVPQIFIDALLAQEDQRFFEHAGVDWVGVARAAYLNAKSGSVTQGAGTVTMQLARNAFDLLGEARRTKQRGFKRKIIEAFAALRIEQEMMKEEELVTDFPDPLARKKAVKTKILELYLNRVPFGGNYYGVRAASLGYFGKEPRDLTMSECASVVACVKNPTRLNPVRHPSRNKIARDHVLRRMAAEGMITLEERDELIAAAVQTDPDPILRGRSHLYEKIEKEAAKVLGAEVMAEGGFVIETTIDLALQEKTEADLRAQLNEIEATQGYRHNKKADYKRTKRGPLYLQGAALSVDNRNGEVLVHIGGRDYAQSQYDFVELGKRPLGTAFFPVIHTAAFENGEGPTTRVPDTPMNNRQLMVGGIEGVVGEWGMEVMNPLYAQEDITARQALVDSKIAATVRLGMQTGLSSVMATAKTLGLEFEKEKLLNRNLVGWNAASVPDAIRAYATYPRGGKKLGKLTYIRRITDALGAVVYEAKPESEGLQVTSPTTAYQIHSILNDVAATGNLKEEMKDVRGGKFLGGVKTGTPYGFTDAWTVGYSDKVTTGIWIGFHQGSRRAITPTGFAKKLAFPVWKKAYLAAAERYPPEAVPMPNSVEIKTCCRASGQKPTLYCNRLEENEETGEVSFHSTTYKEVLPKGTKLGICTVHAAGVEVGSLVQGKPPRKALPVLPIKSKAPLLVGTDPYQSEKPSLAPEDLSEDNALLFNDDTLVVEDFIENDRDALLDLPKPPPFELIIVIDE